MGDEVVVVNFISTTTSSNYASLEQPDPLHIAPPRRTSGIFSNKKLITFRGRATVYHKYS
jgi:hypothetical protein